MRRGVEKIGNPHADPVACLLPVRGGYGDIALSRFILRGIERAILRDGLLHSLRSATQKALEPPPELSFK
jgi:hypothetical protein